MFVSQTPVLVGFTFGAPALLWGLGLASAPLLIHLFFRRRHKEIDWAAMKWLLEAVRRRYRRVRLEQWILLAARTLLVLLVVLAMARPTLDAARRFLTAGIQNKHDLLVLDNSLSMQYRAAGGTRWERAKALAGAILDDSRPGDVASAMVLGSSASVLVGDPSPYVEEVAKEIDSVRPRHGPARIEPGVDQLLRLLPTSPSGRRNVYLITDMQKSTWLGDEENAEGAAALAAKLKALGEQADVTILDVGGQSPNLAVTSVELTDPLVVAYRPAVLRARIANFSPSERTGLKVDLLVDGQVERSETVSVPAHGEQTVLLSHTFKEAGDRAVEVRIGEDSLAIDDHRWLAVRVRQSLVVLVIDGEPSGEPFASESDYLRVALAPESKRDEPPFVKVEVKPESELAEARLDDCDMVVLANVGQFTTAEASVLEGYLRRGGGVLFFLGSQVRAEAYNQVLFAEGKGLLPARLEGLVGEASAKGKFFTFEPLKYAHPIVEPFKDAERAGLLTTKVFRYWKVTPTALRPAQTALAYQTGDPAIVLSPFAKGLVAMVTTSADLDYNRWAISPSYVPIVQELVHQLVANRVSRPSFLAGEPIALPLPREGTAVPVKVTPPGQPASPVPVDESAGGRILYPETDQVGIYRFTLGSPVDERWPIPVNTWPGESNLARLGPEDLKALFPDFRYRIADRWEPHSALTSGTGGDRGELFRPLLYGALGLALLETLLAWRFGHPETKAP